MLSKAIVLLASVILITTTTPLIVDVDTALSGCTMHSVSRPKLREGDLSYVGASLYECAEICQAYNLCKSFSLHPETETCSLYKVKIGIGMQIDEQNSDDVYAVLYSERALTHQSIIGSCQTKQCKPPLRCVVSRQGLGVCSNDWTAFIDKLTQNRKSDGSISKQRGSRNIRVCPRKRGFSLNKQLNFCYKLSSLWQARDSSRRVCAHEGRLARMNTPEKMAAAVEIVRQQHVAEMYVEGMLCEKGWLFPDDKPIHNIKWADDEPSTNFFSLCLTVKPGGFYAENCFTAKQFMCEIVLN